MLTYKQSQGLVEFWTKDWVLETVNHNSGTSDLRSGLKLAVAHTVIAIGAQCSADANISPSIARAYFADAQEYVFAARLQISNLETVQAFLLMAFYLMSACQRNAAYMYLGVAAQAAFVLGLHTSNEASNNTTEDPSNTR